MLGRGMCIRTGPGRCREALPMHLNRDWTMQECSRKASVVPMWSQCVPRGLVPMCPTGAGPNVGPSGLGEACRAAYARRASSHVHANRLLRLAAPWDRPCGSGPLCAHQASSPHVKYKGLRTKHPHWAHALTPPVQDLLLVSACGQGGCLPAN